MCHPAVGRLKFTMLCFMTNKTDNISDDLLVVRIRDDNKDAFKSLYYRYSKKLYYFSLRYLHNSEESEELVQSLFINIWEHRKSLDESIPVKNYIYRSAVNFIYNSLRKKAIRARFLEAELRKGDPHSNLTYDQIFLNDLERSIDKVIQTLTLQQQKIFRLSRYENLTHQEIADRLDLSVRTVENHVFRALKVIRSKLQREVFLLFMVIKIVFSYTFS